MELNKAYADGYNEYGTKSFQEMFLIMSAESEQYSWIWNELKNSTLMVTENYPKTTTDAYNVLCSYKQLDTPRQVHAPPAAVTLVQSGDTEKNETTTGNCGRSFTEVT